MESSQYKLFIDVLKEFDESQVLNNIFIPIGSWCMVLYRGYFDKSIGYKGDIRTKDVDFFVDTKLLHKYKVDIPRSLEKFDFESETKPTVDGDTRLRLLNRKLIVEFLVALVGKETKEKSKPQNLSQLSIIAQPLRFLPFLCKRTVIVDIEDVKNVKVPHPAYFGIHKVLVSTRRSSDLEGREKKKKDIRSAYYVLDAVIKNNEKSAIFEALKELEESHQKCVKIVRKVINEDVDLSSLEIL